VFVVEYVVLGLDAVVGVVVVGRTSAGLVTRIDGVGGDIDRFVDIGKMFFFYMAHYTLVFLTLALPQSILSQDSLRCLLRLKDEMDINEIRGRGDVERGDEIQWRRGRTYRFTPVFLGFLIESIQSGNPYFTHRSQGLIISLQCKVRIKYKDLRIHSRV